MNRFAFLLLAILACCIGVFGARDSWNQVGVLNEVASHNELNLHEQAELLNQQHAKAAADLLDYNVFHILQETASSSSSSTGPQGGGGFHIDLTVLDVNAIDCTNDPIPLNISFGIEYPDPPQTVNTVQVEIDLSCPITQPDCDTDTLGTFSVLQISPTTVVIGASTDSQHVVLIGSPDAVNTSLENIVYNPPAHNSATDVETVADFLIQANITDPPGVPAQAIYGSQIVVRQPPNVPYIYPVDVQSFNNLSATVNSTVVIPPIAVSDLVNPDDLLYVSIDPTNTGFITLNSTTNLTMVPVNPSYPQVVAFVGHLDAINNALSNILFTPSHCSGAFCITHYGFFVLVKDLANTSICPQVAVILCQLDVNANNESTIYAALPAPIVLSTTNDSVSIKFYSAPPGYTFPANTPPPTAYAISWSTDPNTHGYASFVPNLVRSSANEPWQLFTSPHVLPPGTTISLIVGMINEAGLSILSSPPVVFTTNTTVAAHVGEVHILDFTSDSITFGFNPLDQPDITGYIAHVNDSNTPGSQSPDIVIIPVNDEQVVYVLRGLSPFTPYKISVAARNEYGLSPRSEVTQWTKLLGPQIVGFVASDPDTDDNSLDNGDQITITFDIDTNQPTVATKDDLDRVFTFTQTLGADYTGSWINARTCVITLVDVTGSAIQLGVLTAKVSGTGSYALYDANLISDTSYSISPLLVGNWGTAGMLDYFNAPRDALIISENAQTYLGVTTNNAALNATSMYTLTVEILSPQYISSRLSGHQGNWSDPALSISMSGNVTALASAVPSVLFTPARQYAGPVSFQFILNDGTNDVAMLVMSLTINSTNHAPVIIQPELLTALLNNWVPVVSSSGDFIAFNDVDVPIDSTTDAETITISVSQTGLLRFTGNAQVGIKYAPNYETPQRTFQLTGSLYAINLALTALEVQFEYDTESLSAPGNYFIAIEINDNANGGLPALRNYALLNFDIACPSSIDSVQPTFIDHISLTRSGNQLQVVLTRPVTSAVLTAPFFACSDAFTSTTLSMFGTAPSCRWSNSRTIEITLGLGTTVTVNSVVSLRSESLPRCANGEPSTDERSAIVTAGVGAEAPVIPSVSISGPEWASACRSLTLTGEVFQSSSHAVTYTWALPAYFNTEYANIQPMAPSTLHTSFLIINSSAFTMFATPPSSYDFILHVTDYLGQTAKAEYSVSMDRDIKPFITPISQAYTQVYRDEPLNLFASADLPDCGSVGKPSLDRHISYTWTVSPSIDGFTLPSASNLFIPANILSYHASANHNYVFTLRAAMVANPALYTEQHFTVEVLLNDLTPRIKGGDVRTIKFISALTVDASQSYDIDASASSASEYIWSWTCKQLASLTFGSSSTCFDISGTPLALPQTSSLSYGAGQLIPNVYIFTASWWNPSTNRMGSISQTVRVVEYDTTTDIEVDTAKLIVNPFDRVSVQSTVTGPTNFTLVWTTQTSATQSIDYDSSANNLFLNNENEADFFQPGATYRAIVTTTDIDGLTASSSVAFYVNRPPVCSQLSVSPSSGIAMDTYFAFLVASGDCYDPDGDSTDVIYFQYFRVDSNGNKIFMSPSTSSNLLENIALPAGSSVVVGVRISDRHGAYSELTTSVSVAANSASTLTDLIVLYDDRSVLPLERGDAAMVVNAINNIITSAYSVSPALSTANLTTLKDHVLPDLFSQASSLPDALILQSVALIFGDVTSISVSTVTSTLDYINHINADSTILPSILNAVSQFIADGSASGSGRRLLSVLDSETLSSLLTSYVQAVNSILADYSMTYLTYDGDTYRFSQSLFEGAIFRSIAPVTVNSWFSVDGSSVVIPSSAFPDWTVTNVVDVALYSIPESTFSYLGEENQVSDVFTVVAYVPAIQVSPYAPRTVASRELTPMPSNTFIPVNIAFDTAQAINCLNTPVDSDNVCTLECRSWDSSSSSFVTDGVITDFASINSNSTSVPCHTTHTSSIALFRTTRNPLILSSTGSAGGASTGAASDESNAVRVSVELTISPRNGFRTDFIEDISALTGQPESRFAVENVIPTGVHTQVIFVIWAPVTSMDATSLDVYESLRSLTLFDVLSTTYARYADLSTWMMQCPDLVYRSECTGSSGQASWMLPVVIASSVLGLLLLCAVAAVCVRRYRTIDAKDKGVEETMPGAVGAKQFFYTPNAPEASTSTTTSDEVESDVTIVGGVAVSNNTTADVDEEEVSEPIVVENEAVAAEIAKLPMSSHRTSQRTIEEAEEEELSANSRGSLSLSESHFVYVDESKRESSRSSRSGTSDREFSRSGSSASHFRVAANGAEAPSREASTSSRRSSSNNTGMHFRYSDDRTSEVSTSRTPSLPHLNEPHSPSHASRRSQNVAFNTNPDNGSQQSKSEKKAIRIVRPGQQ